MVAWQNYAVTGGVIGYRVRLKPVEDGYPLFCKSRNLAFVFVLEKAHEVKHEIEALIIEPPHGGEQLINALLTHYTAEDQTSEIVGEDADSLAVFGICGFSIGFEVDARTVQNDLLILGQYPPVTEFTGIDLIFKEYL